MEMIRSTQVIQGEGDIATMLKLPKPSHLFPKETVTIHPVLLPDGKPWSADARAPILVLGDSFFNVFSLAGMGWGASAGFVEQLSYTLRQPIDAILRNDAGAFATRELLGQELARGRDRLHGKRVVVWEFAMRELASGTWDLRIPGNSCPERDALSRSPARRTSGRESYHRKHWHSAAPRDYAL